MARKEDMLPPGWEDLDRYVDLLVSDTGFPVVMLFSIGLWNLDPF
jgi:hypothetical protein